MTTCHSGIACKLVRPTCLATNHSSCTVSSRNNFAPMTMSLQEMFTCVFIMVSKVCHNVVNVLRDATPKAHLSLRLLHMKVECLPNHRGRQKRVFIQATTTTAHHNGTFMSWHLRNSIVPRLPQNTWSISIPYTVPFCACAHRPLVTLRD